MKTLGMMCLGALLTLTAPAVAAPLNVTVSIVPQKYFVEKIGGEHTTVSVMVPPGASPATYEPKPRQMIGLAKSQIYFAIGVPFEKAWLEKFHSTAPGLDIVKTDKTIRKLTMPRHHHDDAMDHAHNAHDEHDAHDAHDHKPHAPAHQEHGIIRDPHIWLSPARVRLQADIIRDALIHHNPEDAATYRANHAAFVQEIQATDQKLLKIFAQQDTPITFFVFHPSWSYFAKDYGLTQHALEIEGKAPTPKALAAIIDQARDENVSVIFAQSEFSQKSAQAIADAINGHVVSLSPLAYNWSENLLAVGQEFVSQRGKPTP